MASVADGSERTRRPSLAALDAGHLQERRKLVEEWGQGTEEHELGTPQGEAKKQADEADAKALAAKMREKLAERQSAAAASRLQPLPETGPQLQSPPPPLPQPEPEPEPEPELQFQPMLEPGPTATRQGTESQLHKERLLSRQEEARVAEVEAAQEEAAQLRRKDALRREALAAYEDRITALSESQTPNAREQEPPSPALVAGERGARSSVRPLRSRDASRKALQTAHAALEAIIEDSQWMGTKLAGHKLPVLPNESPRRKDGGQARARVLAADKAAAEAEDWRILVAETDCRAMARRTAPPAWLSSEHAEPNTSLYATAEYSILQRRSGSTTASSSGQQNEFSISAEQSLHASKDGERESNPRSGGYARAVLQELVELERSGDLQPTGLLEQWGASTIQRSYRAKILSPRCAARAIVSFEQLVGGAIRFWRRAHAVRIRDEHEAALARQRELRQSLPWRTAPFTTPTLVTEEAVPPQSYVQSERDGCGHAVTHDLQEDHYEQHRHHHHPYQHHQYEEEEAISGAVDTSASMQIQELQKLLVDVRKELAVATDPTHCRIAEEMLSQIRAQILVHKSTEQNALAQMEDALVEEQIHVGEQRRGQEDEQQQQQQQQQQEEVVLEEEEREQEQEISEAASRRRYPDSPTRHEMVDSDTLAARVGTLDSWLTEQQYQAHIQSPRSQPRVQMRRVVERQPLSERRGNNIDNDDNNKNNNGTTSTSTSLRRAGAVGSSRAEQAQTERSTHWERRERKQRQQHQQSPPSRELREQLALARARAVAIEREQDRRCKKTDRAREAAVVASRSKPAPGWFHALITTSNE